MLPIPIRVPVSNMKFSFTLLVAFCFNKILLVLENTIHDGCILSPRKSSIVDDLSLSGILYGVLEAISVDAFDTI